MSKKNLSSSQERLAQIIKETECPACSEGKKGSPCGIQGGREFIHGARMQAHVYHAVHDEREGTEEEEKKSEEVR